MIRELFAIAIAGNALTDITIASEVKKGRRTRGKATINYQKIDKAAL